MDKDKLLRDIGLDLETFQAHIKRMRKHGKLHKLDVDLLQDKTRKLYDQLFLLEESFSPAERKVSAKTINLPEKMPEAEIPEKVESKKGEPAGTVIHEKKQAETENKITPPPMPEPEPITEDIKAAPVKEKKAPETIKAKTEEQPPEPQEIKVEEAKTPVASDATEPIEEKPGEEDIKPKSAFDLFSSSATETIGDRLGESENASIADQMRKSAIVDLKQAIGINEKFLFINELFNGDLSKYKKAIEEFNALQSREGVSAHLVELKVQNQWDEKNDAFLKLKALLERKFG